VNRPTLFETFIGRQRKALRALNIFVSQ